jgi:hypothetical protein
MKNLGRKYATMDEDERRRFAMKSEGSSDTAPAELDLENPRRSDTVGPPSEEAANGEAEDPEARDTRGARDA